MKKALFIIGIIIICGSSVVFFLNKKDVINNVVSKNVVSNKTLTPISNETESKDKFVQNEYHPIIFMLKDQNGNFSSARLLGGSKDGKWYTMENQKVKVRGQFLEEECLNLPKGEGEPYAETDIAKGGETYRCYSSKEYLTTCEGMKPKVSINGPTLDKLFSVDLKPIKVKNTYNLMIGVNAEWNALPRIPKEIDANTLMIDLDNDGKTEKIIREEKKNEVEGTNDVSYIIEKENKKISLNEDPLPIDGSYIAEEHIMILDLNGDKKMELISFQDGHNQSLAIYELKNDKFVEVMGYYIGD